MVHLWFPLTLSPNTASKPHPPHSNSAATCSQRNSGSLGSFLWRWLGNFRNLTTHGETQNNIVQICKKYLWQETDSLQTSVVHLWFPLTLSPNTCRKRNTFTSKPHPSHPNSAATCSQRNSGSLGCFLWCWLGNFRNLTTHGEPQNNIVHICKKYFWQENDSLQTSVVHLWFPLTLSQNTYRKKTYVVQVAARHFTSNPGPTTTPRMPIQQPMCPLPIPQVLGVPAWPSVVFGRPSSPITGSGTSLAEQFQSLYLFIPVLKHERPTAQY